MRRSPCLLLPFLFAACAGPAPVHESAPVQSPALAVAIDDAESPAPAQVAPAPVGLPSSLTCVTEAVRATGDRVPMVQRVTVFVDGATATAGVARGPQFRQHAGDDETFVGEPAQTLHEGLDIDARGRIRGDGFGLALRRDGLALRGSLALGDEDSVAVTCWNDAEVFGSAWGGGGGVPARFDWATSTCLDGVGKPALNQLPIELVRETGFGECADLSGASLNGEDMNQPSLSGWWLAGARFTGAEMFFGDLTSASLFGADLSGLQMGYAKVSGSVDDATKMPNGVDCETIASPWAGSVTTCSR